MVNEALAPIVEHELDHAMSTSATIRTFRMENRYQMYLRCVP